MTTKPAAAVAPDTVAAANAAEATAAAAVEKAGFLSRCWNWVCSLAWGRIALLAIVSITSWLIPAAVLAVLGVPALWAVIVCLTIGLTCALIGYYSLTPEQKLVVKAIFTKGGFENLMSFA